MSSYHTEHYRLDELVGPEFYKRWGDRCWEWLQVPMLITLDQCREAFGPIIVNNWAEGGPLHESGLRDFHTSTGAEFSQHKFGGAYDMHPLKVTPAEMSAYILAHQEKFLHLTTIEDVAITKTWLHGDCRNHGRQGIWVVQP